MGDARAITDPVIRLYRNVPAVRPGVCRICHTGPNDDPHTGEPYPICSSCERTMRGLHCPTQHVVPISLAVQEDNDDTGDNQLYKVVACNAAAPTPQSRLPPLTLMAATIARFYQAHRACLSGLAGGPFTLVTSVPSMHKNHSAQKPHILTQVLDDVGALRDLYKPLLHANRQYAATLTRRYSHRDAFGVMDAPKETQVLRGERILLVDDLFVSGATIQSAASALFEHGAEEVVALVILRVIVPDPQRPHRMTIWQEATAERFDFDRCCICDRRNHTTAASNL